MGAWSLANITYGHRETSKGGGQRRAERSKEKQSRTASTVEASASRAGCVRPRLVRPTGADVDFLAGRAFGRSWRPPSRPLSPARAELAPMCFPLSSPRLARLEPAAISHELAGGGRRDSRPTSGRSRRARVPPHVCERTEYGRRRRELGGAHVRASKEGGAQLICSVARGGKQQVVAPSVAASVFSLSPQSVASIGAPPKTKRRWRRALSASSSSPPSPSPSSSTPPPPTPAVYVLPRRERTIVHARAWLAYILAVEASGFSEKASVRGNVKSSRAEGVLNDVDVVVALRQPLWIPFPTED